MRTSRKMILTRLLSLVMVFTMVIPMLTVGAAAEDLHDHDDDEYLEYDFDLDAWMAEKDAAAAASADDWIADKEAAAAIEAAHDHDAWKGCVYDASGKRVCTEDSALCALVGGEDHVCLYDEDGNQICCDLIGAEEPSFWEKAWDSVVSFFDMSGVGITAKAKTKCPGGKSNDCLCNDAACCAGPYCEATTMGDEKWCKKATDNNISTGGGDGGGDSGSGGNTTTNITNNYYYTKCPFCGSESTHSGQCPTLATWYSKECAYCRSTSHTMANCPEYKKTLPQDVEICDSCGVVDSCTINGVSWSFPHSVDCELYKEFWDDTVDDAVIENKGSQGVYINGTLVAGTNFDASLIGTGGGGVTTNNDKGFSEAVSKTTSSEATVLTYPRSLNDLLDKKSTGDPEHDFYDDPNWKSIMGSTRRSYSTTDSGIWTYPTASGDKYRIAKVQDNQYVLVRIPSDWDSRLTEINPKSKGNVATPTGSTSTQSVTTTSTSTSTSQPKSTTNNNSSVTFGKEGSGYVQDTKTGTSYNSTAAAGAKAGLTIDASSNTVTKNNVTSGGTTYSIVTESDGKTPKLDKDGNVQVKATTKSTSTSTTTVVVHHCSYSYYYTDVCKTGGSTSFTGDWAYNQGNSGTYGSTGSSNIWDTGSSSLITGNKTDSGFTYNKYNPDDYYYNGKYYGSTKSPIYTTQPVNPGYSTMGTGSTYDPYTSYSTSKTKDYNYNNSYNDYLGTTGTNVQTGSNVTVTGGSGSTYHVKTTFSCCSSNCGSVSEQHDTAGGTTYTDMGPDLHRVEKRCSNCGHIQVSYEAHSPGSTSCTKCGRALGRNVQWHWYNSAEGPVITSIWTPFYSIMQFPAVRGRQDFTFTGWYTDWGGQGQQLNPQREYLYVHAMPGDFYADWAFMIQQDFSAPTISATFYDTEAHAKAGKGTGVVDVNTPAKELWVRLDTIDLEGHSVEAHRDYVGVKLPPDTILYDNITDAKQLEHLKWHQNNPLWTSGLVPDVESWVGSLQLSGEGDTWHETPYVVKVSRNEPLTVIARDAWANTRTHTITITNFDDSAPIIEGFTQSNDSWTNKPVRVNVTAYDDQALAPSAYKWDYTLNSENNATIHAGAYAAMPYMDMPDSGRVRVTVKDAVGKTTTSDWYAVSNIDKIPLNLGTTPYDVSTTEKIAASTGVTITLNITDPCDTVTGMSSGLAQTPIKWIGTGLKDDWTTNRTVTVHSNGTYTAQLKDAVGNVSTFNITINNIVTNGPTVSLSGKDVSGKFLTDKTWWEGPVTLYATATFGDVGARLDGMTYSWDGGVTWTTQSTYVATTNGTYQVVVRDKSGTTATDTIYLGHVDASAPVVGMYLYKGEPDDWWDRFHNDAGQLTRECTERDYVWKLRIEVEDPGSNLEDGNPSLGSGLYSIQYQWLGDRIVNIGNITAADRTALGGTVLTTVGAAGVITGYHHHFDVPYPGTYQVTVYDNAGNVVQVEKVAQWTDLGEGTDGPNPNVPITWPDTEGGPDHNDPKRRGTAGLPYDANLEDLIFGEKGVYNIRTGRFTPYTDPDCPGEGVPVNFQAEITRNRWATGYVTYNNVKYKVYFASPDEEGLPVDPEKDPSGTYYTDKTRDKALGTGNKVYCYAFIPLTAFHQDVKNARIYVTINEWDDQACTKLLKTGTENLYTSVQKSHPTITYTYNRVTDLMTVVATSALCGIENVYFQKGNVKGSDWKEYTGPFTVSKPEPKPDYIWLKAVDFLGNETELEIKVADLGLNGSTGGVGSLPQSEDGLGGDTSSYHSSNRAADIYIIGGTRGNTEQHPSGQVFDRLLGNPDSPTPGGDED